MRCLVLTPTLGTSDNLGRTLKSVAACGAEHVHLIVAPAAVHDGLRERFADIRLVAEAGSGMYAALNAGLAAAADDSWDWFSYLNDDDLWVTTGMRAVFAAAAKHGNRADAVYGRVRLIRENDEPAGELPVARRAADVRALLAHGIVPFAQPGTLVRRSLMEKLGNFDASFRLAGDLDLMVRALLAGSRFAHVPEVVAAFRLRSGQLSKDERSVAAEKERALTPLRLARPPLGHLAVLRFRAGNLRVYLDRFRHHGWARMSKVYRKA